MPTCVLRCVSRSESPSLGWSRKSPNPRIRACSQLANDRLKTVVSGGLGLALAPGDLGERVSGRPSDDLIAVQARVPAGRCLLARGRFEDAGSGKLGSRECWIVMGARATSCSETPALTRPRACRFGGSTLATRWAAVLLSWHCERVPGCADRTLGSPHERNRWVSLLLSRGGAGVSRSRRRAPADRPERN
jgi:hypothetical protein